MPRKIIDISDDNLVKNRLNRKLDDFDAFLARIHQPMYMMIYDKDSMEIALTDQSGDLLSIEDTRTLIKGMRNYCNNNTQAHIDGLNEMARLKENAASENRGHKVKPPVSIERDGYVYILESDHGFKVGKSVNFKDRTSTLIGNMPFRCDVLMSIKVKEYSRAEKECHALVRSKRINGEWFNLTERDTDQIEYHLISNFGGEVILDRREAEIGTKRTVEH